MHFLLVLLMSDGGDISASVTQVACELRRGPRPDSCAPNTIGPVLYEIRLLMQPPSSVNYANQPAVHPVVTRCRSLEPWLAHETALVICQAQVTSEC